MIASLKLQTMRRNQGWHWESRSRIEELMTTFGKVACETPEEDHTSEELEEIVYQKIVEVEEQRKANNENVDLMRNNPNNPLNLMTVPKVPYRSLEDNYLFNWFRKKTKLLRFPALVSSLGIDHGYWKILIYYTKSTIEVSNGSDNYIDHKLELNSGIWRSNTSNLLLGGGKDWVKISTHTRRMKIKKNIRKLYRWFLTQGDYYRTWGWVLSKTGRTDVGQTHGSTNPLA